MSRLREQNEQSQGPHYLFTLLSVYRRFFLVIF